jgi:alpha-D-xyloside xylohydrolase
MKKILILTVFSALALTLKAQTPEVKIQFYTPDIVRVTKTPQNSKGAQKSLVVILDPQNVSVKKSGESYTSSSLKVTVSKDGKVSFAALKGGKLLEENAFNFTPITDGTDKGSFKISQSFKLSENETVYGLGTVQNGRLERNNTETLVEQSNLEDFQNVIQSIKGWGVYWDNYSRGKYSEKNSVMTFEGEAGDLIDYYFMYGKTADGVNACMRELSGKVPMFPLWTFGFWQSKERYKSQDEIIGVVEKYRALGVPLDGIIQDWQYWGNNYLWNAMDFLAETFPDGKAMVDRIHAMNVHIMISIWASFGPMTMQFKELEKDNLLFTFGTWPQSGISHIWPPVMNYPSGVRVYNPFPQKAKDIYWKYLKKLHGCGIDAWWMDSTDPDCFYPTDKDYDFETGFGSFRKMRNAFPLATVSGIYENQRKTSENQRVFIMTRSSYAGQQRYGSNMWSGDVASSWDMLRKQIPAGLNFTLTGNPNFNTDIGGFFSGSYNVLGPASGAKNPQFQELYVRWMQYGMFCPVFRSHGADTPREIYQFGKKGEPIYDAIEKTINLRYSLLPYIYSLAWQVTDKNASYMMPLFAYYKADQKTWKIADEFMFGESILAAPVVSPQYTEEKVIKIDEMTGWNKQETDGAKAYPPVDFTQKKTVEKYLPKGDNWFNFWDNKLYTGGQSVKVETSIDKTPFFVKAGSIIPFAKPAQNTVVQSRDSLTIRIYPGKDCEFTLYEDEGDNYNYEKGAYSLIKFLWNDKAGKLTVSKRGGSFKGMLEKRTFFVEKAGKDGKVKVEYDGKVAEVRLF